MSSVSKDKPVQFLGFKWNKGRATVTRMTKLNLAKVMNFIYKYMYEDYNRNTLVKLHLNKSNDLLVMALNETD